MLTIKYKSKYLSIDFSSDPDGEIELDPRLSLGSRWAFVKKEWKKIAAFALFQLIFAFWIMSVS